MRPRVYIACPITRGGLRTNLACAREAAAALMCAGLAPLNPALSCFAESDNPSATAGFPWEVWIEVSLAWVAASQGVLRLPGESRGADLETELAGSLGIPVFHSVAEVAAFFAEDA